MNPGVLGSAVKFSGGAAELLLAPAAGEEVEVGEDESAFTAIITWAVEMMTIVSSSSLACEMTIVSAMKGLKADALKPANFSGFVYRRESRFFDLYLMLALLGVAADMAI